MQCYKTSFFWLYACNKTWELCNNAYRASNYHQTPMSCSNIVYGFQVSVYWWIYSVAHENIVKIVNFISLYLSQNNKMSWISLTVLFKEKNNVMTNFHMAFQVVTWVSSRDMSGHDSMKSFVSSSHDKSPQIKFGLISVTLDFQHPSEWHDVTTLDLHNDMLWHCVTT